MFIAQRTSYLPCTRMIVAQIPRHDASFCFYFEELIILLIYNSLLMLWKHKIEMAIKNQLLKIKNVALLFITMSRTYTRIIEFAGHSSISSISTSSQFLYNNWEGFSFQKCCHFNLKKRLPKKFALKLLMILRHNAWIMSRWIVQNFISLSVVIRYAVSVNFYNTPYIVCTSF